MFLARLFCCLISQFYALYATIFLCPVDFRKLYFEYADISRPMLLRLLPKKGKKFGGCKNGNVGNKVLKRKVSQRR